MDAAQARDNRRLWDAIGPSFSATRGRPWLPVATFLEKLPLGSRLVDLGCGNGRHLSVAVRAGLRPTGLDVSTTLLNAARAHDAPLVRGLLERPPFRLRTFDAALCVAVMHHVQGRANRVDAWRRVGALLRPGGRLLASTWSTEATAAGRSRNQVPARPEPGDRLVPWGNREGGAERFVHFYAPDELTQELADGGWSVLEETGVALTGGLADNRFATATQP